MPPLPPGRHDDNRAKDNDGEDHMRGGGGSVKGAGGMARARVTEARRWVRAMEKQGSPEPGTRMARAELAAAVSAALAAGVELPSWQSEAVAAVPEQRAAPVAGAGGRCWATKRDGTRCGFAASAGSTLCGAHTHRARAGRAA